jgi:hypothetical protein
VQVFVSYSRAQFYLAEDLALDLGHNGLDAWLDVHRLKPGDEWDGAIVAALRASEAVVLVASREALASPHVHAELDLAQQLGKPVIVALASRVDLPSTLADAPRIDLRSEFGSGVGRLSAVLDEGDDAAPISAIPSSWGARAGVVGGVSAVLLGMSLLFVGLCLLSLGVQLSGGAALSMVDAVNSALFGALSGWLWWTFSRRRAGSTILLGVAFAIAAPMGAFLGCLFVYFLVVAVQQGDVLGVVVDALEVGIAWAPLVAGVSALRSASFYHWLPTGDAPRWMRRRMLARRGHHVVPAPQSAEVPVTYDLRCHEIDGAVQRSLDGALRARGHSPTEAASADRTIVVLSNLSPVDWLDRTLRQLGGKAAILVVSAPVSASALEHFERYHWLDYRGRSRSTLDRLAARIGDVRTVVGAELVPENFARRVLPWGVRVYSGFLVFGATQNLGAGFAGLAGADSVTFMVRRDLRSCRSLR